MQFRLKNISNQNHRVEMHSTNMDTFNQNGPEPGDVVLENSNHSFNACLAGLAGPLITCTGSLPTAGFRTVNAFDGLFYLNGVEYNFNVPGETFLDKYRNLAANNLDLDMLLEVTEINENPNEVMFTAASPTPVRVAIVASNGGVVNWQQQPSETAVNETIEITDSQVTFCLMGRWSFDINKPNSLFIDNQNYISLQMFPNNPILLDETNVQLTIMDGVAEITTDFLSENYASWSVKAKSAGKLHFQLWCPFLIPEYQLFEIDASEMPVMELVAPGLFDWNIRSQSVSLSAIDQSFNDGLTIPAAQMQYQITSKTTYPPYHSNAVGLISKELLFSAIGSSELVGHAYHPAVGQVLDSKSKLINVFGVPDGVDLGILEPGSSTEVTIALEGVVDLPAGWTTQLTKRSPLSTDISAMANWSIDPTNPIHITVNVIGGDYANNIILGLDYIDPDGNPTITTEINFRINTN